jgi:hypothetical protein
VNTIRNQDNSESRMGEIFIEKVAKKSSYTSNVV